MSKENNLTDFLTDVASAIKDKRGIGSVNAQNFSTEIRAIEPLLDTLNITENGKHDVKDYKNVSVVVESEADVQLRGIIERNSDTIIIPYGITKIGQGAFSSSNSRIYGDEVPINKFYIPITVKKISAFAFSNAETKGSSSYGCLFYYEGSFKEWATIEKGYIDKSKDTSAFFTISVDTNATIESNKVLLIKNKDGIYNKVTDYDLTGLNELPIGSLSLLNLMNNSVPTNITIPKSISKIGEGCFCAASSLTSIIFEDGSNLEEVPRYAFAKTKFENKEVEYNVILPSSVKSIRNHSFFGSNIKSVKLSENLETIGLAAFNSCYELTKITLPKKLKTIGANAFNSCSSLREITLPENLETIGDRAFNSCSNLKIINIESSTPFTLESTNVFPKVSGNRYYVPKGTLETFKSATNWSSYASYLYSKYVVVFNIPTALVNNEEITYSIDGGKTYQQFTNSVLSLDDVATIKIKSTDSSQVVKIGTSAGASDVGTISNSELTFSFTTDTNVYLTIQ